MCNGKNKIQKSSVWGQIFFIKSMHAILRNRLPHTQGSTQWVRDSCTDLFPENGNCLEQFQYLYPDPWNISKVQTFAVMDVLLHFHTVSPKSQMTPITSHIIVTSNESIA